MNGIPLSNLLAEPQTPAVMAERSPCDQCHQQHCQTQAIACWDYAHWLEKGTVRKKHRQPSQRIYRQAMAS